MKKPDIPRLLLSVFAVGVFLVSSLLAQNGFIDSQIEGDVYDLEVQPDGKIVIGGSFREVGGQSIRAVARLNPNGALDTSFTPPVIFGNSRTVSDVLRLSNGQIIISGSFSGIGSHNTSGLARLNTDGSVDTSFSSSVAGYAYKFALQPDGKFIIAGSFLTVGGVSRQGVARILPDGAIDSTFQDPQITSTASQVSSVVLQPDGKILIGGWFTAVGNQQRSYFARLEANGQLDTQFSTQVNGPVEKIFRHPTGSIYISGFFQNVNGVPRRCLAKLTETGELDTSLQSSTNDSNITTFAVQPDGKILVGGGFTEFAGVEHRSFARLNADGSYDPSFPDPNRNFGGRFYSIYPIVIQTDGKILIGGDFDTIAYLPRSGVVRFNPDGTLDTPSETITVTKTADTNDGTCDTDCSLREAVVRANIAPETTTIAFDPAVFSTPQTITLTLGEMSINSRITVLGPGSDLLTVSGNNASRIFVVEGDAIFSIENVTLANGRAISAVFSGEGGAIWVQPNGIITRLDLANVILRGNEGTLVGAIGTFNRCVATLRDVVFENNRSSSMNGGTAAMLFRGEELTILRTSVRNNSCAGSNCSGGINAAGSVLIEDSVFNGNTGRALGLGGTVTVSNTQITNNFGGGLSTGGFGLKVIRNSVISGNTTAGDGGGLNNANAAAVRIIDSTISDNRATNGGGIFTAGNLTLEGVSLLGNVSTNGGGGLYNLTSSTPVTTVVNNSILSNNSAQAGGAIYNRERVEISGSRFTGNTVTVNGGAIFNVLLAGGVAATLSLQNSSFDNNSAPSGTGGAVSNQGGQVSLVNSTISGNRALAGGGLRNTSGGMSLNHVTVAENRATSSGAGVSNSGLITSRNSLFANNLNTASGSGGDFFGTLESEGHNLLTSSAGATIVGNVTGNRINVIAGLGPIGLYGGNTVTHPLSAGNPAIDAADPTAFAAVDQRGIQRPVDGDGDGNARADIGAFEARSLIVSNTNDSGSGSLRQAIADANTSDAIIFDAAAFPTATTLVLSGGELRIASGKSISIGGPGADRLTIDGGNSSRIFTVDDGAALVLSGVTLANGNGLGSTDTQLGGAISSRGDLTILRSVIRNNSTLTEGGGIAVLGGKLQLTSSTLHDNHAQNGGAIYFSNLALPGSTVTNATLSGNAAVSSGGAMVLASSVRFDFVTVAANTVSNGDGGGVYVLPSGSLTSSNSIYADNSAQGSGTSHDVYGAMISNGFNLVEVASGLQISGTTSGNQLGVDPKLGPLSLNGGTTPVKPIRFRSPAIDTAHPTVYLLRDQIGRVRPLDGDSNTAFRADIGAYEFDPTVDNTGSTPFDFDGDGKADLGVYREGEWIVYGTEAGYSGTVWGNETDKIVAADYDGDGKTDHAVYRDGTWWVLKSTGGFSGAEWGVASDTPVPADYDGDGKADLAIYRGGTWWIYQTTAGAVTASWGNPTDIPIPADYDGDGKADIAIFREGTFWILKSTGGFMGAEWGTGTDKPVPADYDGDGRADLAIYREGAWWIYQTTAGALNVVWGNPGDVPIPADYDGDGKTDVAIFRGGTWWIYKSTGGFMGAPWGTASDIPIPRR